MDTLSRAVSCLVLFTAAACATTSAAGDPVPAAQASELRPAAAWDTSEEARAIIRKNEALRLEAYPEGELRLIGYGHVMAAGEAEVITEADAERLLVEDLQECEAAVETAVETPLTLGEFSALVSLCHNIGTGAFASSTAVKKLNAGDRSGAAEAILLWNKADGVVLANLQDRREKERKLFLGSAPLALAANAER
jgi:lysozyme